MGVAKRVLKVIGTVLRCVGKFFVMWARFVARVITLYWHFGG